MLRVGVKTLCNITRNEQKNTGKIVGIHCFPGMCALPKGSDSACIAVASCLIFLLAFIWATFFALGHTSGSQPGVRESPGGCELLSSGPRVNLVI